MQGKDSVQGCTTNPLTLRIDSSSLSGRHLSRGGLPPKPSRHNTWRNPNVGNNYGVPHDDALVVNWGSSDEDDSADAAAPSNQPPATNSAPIRSHHPARVDRNDPLAAPQPQSSVAAAARERARQANIKPKRPLDSQSPASGIDRSTKRQKTPSSAPAASSNPEKAAKSPKPLKAKPPPSLPAPPPSNSAAAPSLRAGDLPTLGAPGAATPAGSAAASDDTSPPQHPATGAQAMSLPTLQNGDAAFHATYTDDSPIVHPTVCAWSRLHVPNHELLVGHHRQKNAGGCRGACCWQPQP
jgi:hypothetical protein